MASSGWLPSAAISKKYRQPRGVISKMAGNQRSAAKGMKDISHLVLAQVDNANISLERAQRAGSSLDSFSADAEE